MKNSFDNFLCFIFGLFVMCFIIVIAILVIDGFAVIWLIIFSISFIAGYCFAKWRNK